jgi:putative Holliday junction resolvase
MAKKMVSKYTKRKILAVDYGRKFSGLATFIPEVDPFVLLYGRLAYQSDEKLILDLKKIIDDEAIDLVVVGVPLYLNGDKSNMTRIVEGFVEKLKNALPNLEIFTQDETLTSFEAEDRMKNSPRFGFKVDKTQVDAVAASVILEDFLRL